MNYITIHDFLLAKLINIKANIRRILLNHKLENHEQTHSELFIYLYKTITIILSNQHNMLKLCEKGCLNLIKECCLIRKINQKILNI